MHLSVTTGDVDCRYLAAPESSDNSQFGRHLKSLGIKLPAGLSIRTMVARGWLKPRLRVALPVPALLSWRNFPTYEADYDGTCPAEDAWALNVWCASACGWDDRNCPSEKLWMHWLDDPEDCTAVKARANVLQPPHDPEPTSFVHPRRGQSVLPWIDFFADWQAYHVAELVRSANFTVHGVTDSFGSGLTCIQRHTERFDGDARELAQRWEQRGAFFDWVASYRTILSHCCMRESFNEDARSGALSWAKQRGAEPAAIRTGIRDVLLVLWTRWDANCPAKGPHLMQRLQQDIQYATHLLADLTDEPVDPFDPLWYSKTFSRGESADLIDALPHEEWLARRDFARQAVGYQRTFPSPLMMGEVQFAQLLGRHWEVCPPLRRFCLAWVRLHTQLGSQDRDRPADQIIAANERIEQFNLIGLHTERIVRFVDDAVAPRGGKQASSNTVFRVAAQRAIASFAPTVTLASDVVDGLIRQHTRLHDLDETSDLGQMLRGSRGIATGSEIADQLLHAHLDAAIARNYAAHHDCLDDQLIYPNRDETKTHAGNMLLCSCLLVVIAALRSLPQAGTTKP